MRIQVNVGEPLLKKIDKYSEICGVTRSAFCSMLISQGVMGYETSFEVFDKVKETLPDTLREVLEKKVKIDE